VFAEESFAVRQRKNYFFRRFCGKKHLRLINYGIFAEETHL